jgi:hypothetical protein
LGGIKKLPEKRKVSMFVPFCNNGDRADCSNYIVISLWSNANKILSKILLPGLTPYAEEIIEYHQRGLRRNWSTADHIICIRQILEKK